MSNFEFSTIMASIWTTNAELTKSKTSCVLALIFGLLSALQGLGSLISKMGLFQ